MATENNGPLDINLPTGEAKTQVPVVADGKWVDLRLANITQGYVPQKGKVLKFTWELASPTVTTEGRPLNPGDFGSSFFDDIQLYDKNTKEGDPAPKWAINKLSKRIDACLGTGDKDNPKGKPTRPDFGSEVGGMMIGKLAKVKMGVKTGDFTGNEFKDVQFPADVSA